MQRTYTIFFEELVFILNVIDTNQRDTDFLN